MDPYIVDSHLIPALLKSCNLEKPFDIQEGVKNLLEYMWACLEVTDKLQSPLELLIEDASFPALPFLTEIFELLVAAVLVG